MHKFFDNILFYLQRSGGGSVYWGELMKRFNEEKSVSFIEPNLRSSNIVLDHLDLQPVFRERNIPLKVLRYLPVTHQMEEGSIFHSSYYRFCNHRQVKNVVTVHDFIYEHFGSGLSRFVHNRQKGMAIRKSRGIICISNSTKQDLVHFFPDLLKGKEISVIYNGVSDDFYPLQNQVQLEIKYSGAHEVKYVLYVGHRTKYKNFDFAAQVLKELPSNYKLAIVGNKLTEEELKYLTINIPDQFKFFGNISNVELNELYNISECLLYPSSYEGFGIPVIEAFKCGCPVVALNIPVVKEIAGDGALLSNGLNTLSFRDHILSLSNDRSKNNLINIGLENAKKYSWDKCFSEVNNFYNSI